MALQKKHGRDQQQQQQQQQQHGEQHCRAKVKEVGAPNSSRIEMGVLPKSLFPCPCNLIPTTLGSPVQLLHDPFDWEA